VSGIGFTARLGSHEPERPSAGAARPSDTMRLVITAIHRDLGPSPCVYDVFPLMKEHGYKRLTASAGPEDDGCLEEGCLIAGRIALRWEELKRRGVTFTWEFDVSLPCLEETLKYLPDGERRAIERLGIHSDAFRTGLGRALWERAHAPRVREMTLRQLVRDEIENLKKSR
jgi:hypothetical protein